MKDQAIVTGLNQPSVFTCTREDAKRLQSQRYVMPHKRSRSVWIALVDVAIIRAELRRKISRQLPIAEDNRTVIRDGRSWAHHMRHCEAFA